MVHFRDFYIRAVIMLGGKRPNKNALPLPSVPERPAMLQERMITQVIYNWRLRKLSSPGINMSS